MGQDSSNDETRSIALDFDSSEIAGRESPHSARAPLTPDQIGPYKILSELGAGGMGVVYLAEQTKPIHRRVALKIIRLGMDTRQVVARFETEREALALMNHPNVAKVFDAGATETGRPYFAMEYVQGIPITEHCDKLRLNTEERLRLFLDVCHAVQHAHQKGIIHRDIKPSNVLVTEIDNVPIVKVIDFGIAKATQQKLTEQTFATEQGMLMGTPAYMSPEQAEMTTLDIDTRTDIYSLGVLLYELLVGALPFDTKSLLRAGLAGIQHIIREVDPPKPSTKLSNLGEASNAIAHQRRTQIRSLARELRGDVDWIVMKCLEKDRTRRYDTANGVALEIERYLNHEPVLAGPPSATYRMRKFVRRNRTFMASVAATMLALSIGLSVAVGMYLRAERAREETALERDRAYEAERAADHARDEAEQVTRFLTDTLASVDPSRQGKDVTVREVLGQAAKTIVRDFSNRPLIEARLHKTLGVAYFGLGLFDQAESHLADAAAIFRRILGEQDPRSLAATNALAGSMVMTGKYSASQAAQRTTLEIRRRALGEDHPDTLVSMSDLALALWHEGRYAEAESLYRTVLEAQRRVMGEKHQITLAVMINLGGTLAAQGRNAEAELLYRDVLGRCAGVLPPEHPIVLTLMNNLAAVLADQDRYGEAEELCQKTLEIRRRTLGNQHEKTLGSMNELANVLSNQGRHAEAEELAREALAIWVEQGKANHSEHFLMTSICGGALSGLGRFNEAEPLLVSSYEAVKDRSDVTPPRQHRMVERIIRHYESWDAAEPGKGYNAKAAEWRARYDESSLK